MRNNGFRNRPSAAAGAAPQTQSMAAPAENEAGKLTPFRLIIELALPMLTPEQLEQLRRRYEAARPLMGFPPDAPSAFN
jgi:hypothetical protein